MRPKSTLGLAHIALWPLAALAAASVAPAQTYDFYPTNVLTSGSWVRETQVLGAPGNTDCGNTQLWASNVSNDSAQLHTFEFEAPIGSSANRIVKRAWVDVLCSFRNSEEGEVRTRILEPDGTVIATRIRCLPAGDHQVCRWLYGGAGSGVTSALVGLPASQIGTLSILVNRDPNLASNCGNDRNFKVKAVKLTIELVDDCDGNGEDDELQLNSITDCDDNGVLDECEVNSSNDCDGNMRIDSCELNSSTDCNGDDILDVCQINSQTDCNGNMVLDVCELNATTDCDSNGVLDSCEIGPGNDCNQNNQLDSCDIAAGIETDCDGNLVPDSCQIEDMPILDIDGNGILDECEYAGTPYCGPAVPNSTGAAGVLVALGTNSLAQNNLDLWCGQLPDQSNGYIVVSQGAVLVPMAGSSVGTLCIGGAPVGRYAGNVFQATATGIVTIGVDATSIPQPMGPVAAQLGQTWNFQAWYRDTDLPTGNPISNFSSAVRVTFEP